MAYYIKVSSKVAQHIGVCDVRYHVLVDDTYLLWQADLALFGIPGDFQSVVEAIGGVALQPWETRLEQLGETLHELPKPTDERFVEDDEAKEGSGKEDPGEGGES